MCRIAGIASRITPLPEMERRVKKMCDIQKHGGPDDEGMYSCSKNNLVLGHRRLALIDLSTGGHQPMQYNGRYTISFNGEIYNYKDLKAELANAGSVFHTDSDTEVILAAFEKWNTQSFIKLSGMFAFALYDADNNQLYLVRDASGIKPMYYSVSDGSVEFASEMRAFTVLQKKENNKWPVYQLAYGHIPEPVTTLENVLPLHKGCFYRYDLATNTGSLQSFNHYSFSDTCSDRPEAIALVNRTMRESVGRHLIADAPIGVFLSGGIDSSIIAMAASRYKKEQLKTLSLYFREQVFSEKAYQDEVISALQCYHYQHLLENVEFESAFPQILDDMDMPSCDGVNTWFISKYAKANNLKAVLSGVGGDELFGGYPSFDRIALALKLQNMPGVMAKRLSHTQLKRVKRLQYLSLEGAKGMYLFLRGLFIPSEIARQLGASEKEVWNILQEEPVTSRLNCLSPKNEASWVEMNMYMQNQLLRDADVMSMAHGVEIRVPFLDTQLVKLALSIESNVKYSGSLPKQLLIDAFKDVLPQSVWKRKKMGFSFPFAQWLAGSELVKDTMANSSTAFAQSYKKFQEGRLHWSHLMSLVILRRRGIA